jgi:hypothetical protein
MWEGLHGVGSAAQVLQLRQLLLWHMPHWLLLLLLQGWQVLHSLVLHSLVLLWGVLPCPGGQRQAA